MPERCHGGDPRPTVSLALTRIPEDSVSLAHSPSPFSPVRIMPCFSLMCSVPDGQYARNTLLLSSRFESMKYFIDKPSLPRNLHKSMKYFSRFETIEVKSLLSIV